MKANRRRWARLGAGLGIIGFVLIACWLIVVRYGSPKLIYSGQFKAGDRLIQRIEAFKAQSGRLPAALDLSLDERSPQYDNVHGDYYTVRVGTGFDEYYIYDSRTGCWNFEHCEDKQLSR